MHCVSLVLTWLLIIEQVVFLVDIAWVPRWLFGRGQWSSILSPPSLCHKQRYALRALTEESICSHDVEHWNLVLKRLRLLQLLVIIQRCEVFTISLEAITQRRVGHWLRHLVVVHAIVFNWDRQPPCRRWVSEWCLTDVVATLWSSTIAKLILLACLVGAYEAVLDLSLIQ